MYRQKRNCSWLADSPSRALHRFADVIKLQIKKNLLAPAAHTPDKLHARGRIQFHSDFVEIDSGTDPLNEFQRLAGIVYIQGNDDGVQCVTSIGLSPRSVTRPMT